MLIEACLISPKESLIMFKLKTESEKALPDGVMSLVRKSPRAERIKLADSKNKNVQEDLSIPTRISRTECMKTDASSRLESHKRSMYVTNQDPNRPFVIRYLVAETTTQLKA